MKINDKKYWSEFYFNNNELTKKPSLFAQYLVENSVINTIVMLFIELPFYPFFKVCHISNCPTNYKIKLFFNFFRLLNSYPCTCQAARRMSKRMTRESPPLAEVLCARASISDRKTSNLLAYSA